ncbi:MAG: hypothetical protein PUD92_07285 [Clostridiales bacterium]|nr:hypothetical protein [Clostridiales bacterium]
MNKENNLKLINTIEEMWESLTQNNSDFDRELFKTAIKQTYLLLKNQDNMMSKSVLNIVLLMQKFYLNYTGMFEFETEIDSDYIAAKFITKELIEAFKNDSLYEKIQLCLDYYSEEGDLILEDPFPVFDFETLEMNEIINDTQLLKENNMDIDSLMWD